MSLDNILLIPGVGEWTPASLFKPGDVGIWQDMSNFSTLRQLSDGTVSVTSPGDPIGFVADMSKGGLNKIGPELVTNGTFESASNWTLTQPTSGSVVIAGGQLSINSLDGTFASAAANPAIVPVVGRAYEVRYDVFSATGGGVRADFGGVQGTARTSPGSYSQVIVAASTANLSVVRGSGVSSGTIDNISVREIPGHITTQTTSGKRPILSRTPEGGVRQLLQWSEDLTGSSWLQIGATRPSATVMRETATTGVHYVYQTGNLNAGNHVLRVTCKYDGRQWIRVHSFRGATRAAYFDLQNGVVGAETSVVDASITDVGDGFYECQIVFDVAAAGSGDWGFRTAIADGNDNFAGDAALGVIFRDAQLEEGTTPTTYQKATTRYNITETGKRDCWAFGYDGIDDAMSTPSSVDMSGSDEMTVCVGVRKLSDAASGILVELSPNALDSGKFFALAPSTSGANSYRYSSRGSSVSDAGTGVFAAAPDSAVILGESKISTDVCKISRNATLVESVSGDQGTGNYGDYRIYFSARAETSVFFTGLVYQTVIINRLLSDYEKTKLQQFVARKMGITL